MSFRQVPLSLLRVGGLPSLRQFVSLPPGTGHPAVLVGHVAVGELLGLGIPLELLAGAIGNISQQHRLREWSGIVEIAGGRTARLACLCPFVCVADCAWDGPRGRLETGIRLLRIELEPRRYYFDFGDGSNSGWLTTSSVTHKYSDGTREYIVSVSVKDDDGETGITETTIQIKNRAPTAAAGDDKITDTNQPLAFDGSASSDMDGKIKSYSWDFGDGQTAEGKIVSHIYKKTGTYTAMLTVRDNTGHESATSYDVTSVFINSPPVAIARYDILASPGQIIQFDGSKSYDPDGRTLSYQWDFSDDSKTAKTAIANV